MDSPQAAKRWPDEGQIFVATAAEAGVFSRASSTLRILSWAWVESTVSRFRRGEGALLAVSLSLVAAQGFTFPRSLAQVAVATLVFVLMYAFNDLHDAPVDLSNPKKDRALIAAYLEHRQACLLSLAATKLLVLSLAFAALGWQAAAAAGTAMAVNLVYSTMLKGVPVVDVAWCGIWGASYVAIVDARPALLVLVGLMTSICHLYQTLDDRVSDAASGITTTAVRSPTLSATVLLVLSALLFVVLRESLGGVWALTAFTPFAFFCVAPTPLAGWILTKTYFGAVWLFVLGILRAAH